MLTNSPGYHNLDTTQDGHNQGGGDDDGEGADEVRGDRAGGGADSEAGSSGGSLLGRRCLSLGV